MVVLTTRSSHMVAWAETFLQVPKEERLFDTVYVHMRDLGLTMIMAVHQDPTGAPVEAQEQPEAAGGIPRS